MPCYSRFPLRLVGDPPACRYLRLPLFNSGWLSNESTPGHGRAHADRHHHSLFVLEAWQRYTHHHSDHLPGWSSILGLLEWHPTPRRSTDNRDFAQFKFWRSHPNGWLVG